MIELMFLKELMLIRQAKQKSTIFAAVSIFFKKKGFKFQSYLCSRCHDLVVMMSMSLNNIAILSIKDFFFSIIIRLHKKYNKTKINTAEPWPQYTVLFGET